MGNQQQNNIHIMGILGREEGEKETEILFKEKIAEFPKYRKQYGHLGT